MYKSCKTSTGQIVLGHKVTRLLAANKSSIQIQIQIREIFVLQSSRKNLIAVNNLVI